MFNLPHIKKLLPLLTLLIAMAALTLGTANVSWADSLNEEMRDFNHFLNEHPRIAADLQRDPSLANNSGYLHAHDNLKDFLHNHPQVRRQIAANPGYALGAPYAWNGRPYGVYPPYNSAPYGLYPPYNSAPYGVYPPYTAPRYGIYRPYDSRRYGSYRPYNHRPHGDDSHDKAASEHR